MSHFVHSQVGTGEWRLHVSTMEAIDVASKDSFVYTAYESGVMEYNIHTSEKVMLDKINYLSDIQVSCIDMDTVENTNCSVVNCFCIDLLTLACPLTFDQTRIAHSARRLCTCTCLKSINQSINRSIDRSINQ